MEFRRGVGWSSPALTLTSWHLWFLLPGDDAPLFLPGRTKMGHCKSPSCQASLQICLIVQGTYKYLQWIPVNQPYLGSLEGCLHGICGKQSEQTKRTLTGMEMTGMLLPSTTSPPFNPCCSCEMKTQSSTGMIRDACCCFFGQPLTLTTTIVLGARSIKGSFAAMSCEVKVNTLQGGVITLDLPMTATVRELKAMLLEKHPCQDPSKRKVLQVELVRNTAIIDIDDTETLSSGGFLSAESQLSVAYTANEVEAATKHDIHTRGSFGVTIPSNVTNISRKAFKSSQQLVLLTMPESVRTIGDSAFECCTSLEKITFGESVTHIGDDAFRCCTSLESIALSDSVTHIGISAFAHCRSLESITLGESVTHIGDDAFQYCSSLESITLGESVTHIGSSAFANCMCLESITLGESVTHIGSGAFQYCSSLKSITLGESVTHIGSSAFANCMCLESITLGESVTHIGDDAFQYCSSLESITLGESVTHIGSSAFANCMCLESITLGESVTHIGSGAFQYCSSLKSITLGESVTHIGSSAFANCRSLASITFGESVTRIGRSAFANCTLESIRFPESLRHILERELGATTMARIAIPAKRGRKRLWQEWVNEWVSDRSVMPMIGATCRTLCVCVFQSASGLVMSSDCAWQSHAHIIYSMHNICI